MLKPLVLGVLCLLVWYFYRKLHYRRFKKYANLPQLPSSLILGHLGKFNEFTRRGKADRHPDAVFSEMIASIGNPPLMFLDLWPVGPGLVIVNNHEIAEQVTKSTEQLPVSAPRSPLTYLEPIIGSNSILAAYGEEWKALRRRFNPGFAPQHIKTLLPCILEKTSVYIDRLDSFASTGAEFHLVHLTIDLIFDIMGAIVMDTNLEAQHSDISRKGELIRLYNDLLSTYSNDKVSLPWWLRPGRIIKYRLSQRIDKLVKALVYQKHAEQQRYDKERRPSRSILSLSLQNSEKLTPQLVGIISDQIKTFLFAGHDTTSIALAWAFYELSRTPRASLAVRAELDHVLGPATDPAQVRARLLCPDGPDLIQRLSYVNAVLKEALRLHPPAGTGRTAEPGATLTVRTADGDEYHLKDDTSIYVCATCIHQDPKIYGDSAKDFVPERWLREDKAESLRNDIPQGAWRPFERGPRNCIGQDFAMFEMRAIVALVARRYDFVKVGLGEILIDDNGQPTLQDNGQYAVNTPLYNTRQVTAKPVDGMLVKVRKAFKSGTADEKINASTTV